MTNGANDNLLIGIIDRFEAEKAVIKTENGQEIIWPIQKLPDGATEGGAVKLVLTTDGEIGAEKENLAKAMLNEILKTDENKSPS